MPLDPLRPAIDRRSFLMSAASLACASLVLRDARAGVPAAKEVNLVAAPARLPIVGAPYPETDVWCYSGQSPGPEIRVRQGDHVRIVVDNRLSEDTTVHWHGLRVPNAMDGAPDVTQPSIQPGESFSYEFAVRDAGTYWYHPHAHSAEQVGRGLAGAFIVEEQNPLPVDRDVVWVLGDWRLRRDAAIAEDFNNPMEMSMSGRIGNTVTINGRVPTRFEVRSGERIRLRLRRAADRTARARGRPHRARPGHARRFDYRHDRSTRQFGVGDRHVLPGSRLQARRGRLQR